MGSGQPRSGREIQASKAWLHGWPGPTPPWASSAAAVLLFETIYIFFLLNPHDVPVNICTSRHLDSLEGGVRRVLPSHFCRGPGDPEATGTGFGVWILTAGHMGRMACSALVLLAL